MSDRSEVCLAILSCIEPLLPECLAAVEAQEGGPYRIVHVENVFPLSAAFNAMIERCESRFIVQVDGDVVLEPWAVRRLHEAISKSWWCYAAFGQLFEEEFGLGGSVRIWRRWPVRLIGFRDRRCVDRDLHNRISLLGMQRIPVDAGESFGTHYPRNTSFARFSKARNDAMKWRYLDRWDLIESANARGFSHEGLLGFGDGLLSDSDEELPRSKNSQRDWHRFLTRPGGP